MEHGTLTVRLPSGEQFGHSGPLPGPSAAIAFHNRRGLARLAFGGANGLARGYIAGDWSSPDLAALLTLGAANTGPIDRALSGSVALRMADRLGHALSRNSLAGSRRNIAAHYDLGNEFYRLWLDATMMYSSARAIRPGQSLEAAQTERIDHIAGLLGIRGGERVLEIGTGWGGLAARLAQRGARVTGLTLSREQLDHARARIAAQGIAGRVDLRLRDYRHEQGLYDRIVSIEMIEAVGERWWPAYFGRLRACLNAGGRVVLQAITIREDRFASYRRNPDFIQRHVFPGGMLPTAAIIAEQARAAGLRIIMRESFASGYAQTLAEWRRRFLGAWDEIAALGFDARFRRLWEYYLCYCEAGFRTGNIDVGLTVLEHA